MARNGKSGGGTGARSEPSGHTFEVIKSLVTGEAEASRLLEMYYWTREPEIFELIRAYLDLPERAQRQLSDFLLKNRPQSVAAAIDEQGRLLLSADDKQGKQQNRRNAGS
ncbi:MAG: hypothetical protein Q8M24_20535 [Pseudolabrys sp.]|nr:hypothetical protein [Pseudolabrys sp.]MDP2297839.1 hypothetical protein [Pseudolabrys sp.]